MGEPTKARVISDSFIDELQKIAVAPVQAQQQPIPAWKRALIGGGLAVGALGLGAAVAPGVAHGIAGGLRTTGRMMRSPASTKAVMQRGWQSMANVNPRAVEGIAESKRFGLFGRKLEQPEILKRHGHLVKQDAGGNLVAQKQVGLRKAYEQGGARGVAHELSRGGWTGSGAMLPGSQYLPVGMKSMMLGIPAAMLPSDMKKGDPEFTGMGRAERAGKSVGETAGYVAGFPIGMGVGAATARKMVQEAGKRGRWAKYMARGKGGLVPVLVGSSVTGLAGAMAGRAAGRGVDLMTGERQQAKARKGLKDYLQYRHKQILREQQRAAGVGAY